MPRKFKTHSVELDHRDYCLILGCLREYGLREQGVLNVLRVSLCRDLKRHERFMLPINLRELSHKELKNSVDHWISMVDHISWLMEKFEKAEQETSSAGIKKRRKAGEIL